MKVLVRIGLTLSVLFCMLSCNEKVNSELLENVRPITVTTEVESHVKAGYEGTTVLPEEFHIYIGQTELDYNKLMLKDPAGNNYTPADNSTLFWEDDDHSDVKVSALTIPYGLTGLDITNPMEVKIHQDQSDADNLIASDLLGAVTGNGIEIEQDNINIAFNHLMSKLQISYTKPDAVQVTSVQIKNICVKGGYSFASMSYDSSIAADFGDITMYHDSGNKSAEAIFFPYTPESAPELVVNVTINGQAKAFECPVVLKNGTTGFAGGKRYIMSVTISETEITGVVTMIKNWNASGSTQMSDEKILWVGTSIPAGGYPQLVGAALGCTVVNNAVGGTLVTMQKDASWFDETNWNPLLAGALVQTHAEAENIYGSKISSDELATIQSYSYESLIIPYIDGTIDNCTTVILDHGYNDLSAILYERNAFMTTEAEQPYRGYAHLMQLINGEKTYQEYYSSVQSNSDLFEKGCYIIAMTHIIQSIKEVAAKQNKDIRIIVGNYFAINNPFLAFVYKVYNEDPTPGSALTGAYPDYDYTASMICHSNEAVASVNNLEIVNVYEHLYIPDDMFCNLSQNSLNNQTDDSKFCPDGVHPTNEYARQAITDIWTRSLRDILK